MCKVDSTSQLPEGSITAVARFGVTPAGMALMRAGDDEFIESLAHGVYESVWDWARKQVEEREEQDDVRR